MRNFLYLLFPLLTLTVGAQQTDLLADFEPTGSDVTLTNWNSELQSTTVGNPLPDGVNSSGYVAQLTMISDAQQVAGVNAISGFYNATDNNVVTMKVWTPHQVEVNVKLENSPDWGGQNTVATTTVTTLNQWVEVSLTFDTSNIHLNKFGIYFSGDNNVEGSTYYVDDITTPALFTSPQVSYNLSEGQTDVTLGTNVIMTSNNGFRALDDSALTDLSSSVFLREGSPTGTDVAFTASISNGSTGKSNNVITITPDNNLSSQTTYYAGVTDGAIEFEDDTAVSGAQVSFTTKEAVSGDISVVLFDYETPDTDTAFGSWGSAGFEQVSNPDPNVVNSSASVGKFTHPGGSWTSGIESDGTFENIDFSETPYFRMKVWADKPIEVTFKLQNNPNYWENTEVKKSISNDQINQWVELVFDFSGTTATNYNRLQLWFDGDIAGGSVAGDVYYFDDVSKSNIAPPVETTFVPVNAATEVDLTNEISITSNTKMLNADGSEITDPTSLVELKLGDANGAAVPFKAAIDSNGKKITLIPDAMLSSNTTYYFAIKEGVAQYEVGGSAVSGITSSFTTTLAAAPNMVSYADNQGNADLISVQDTMGDPAPSAAVVPDPDNGANLVLQWDKGTSFGGWERIHYELDAPYDASKDDVFSIRVRSPHATYMRFKLANAKEDGDITASKEVDADIVLVDQWQTLYFDVSDLEDTVSFNHLFVFIAGGDATARTYYIDDLKGPELQETASLNYAEQMLKVYPNPASETLYFPVEMIGSDVSIYDYTGRAVKTAKLENSALDIKNLQKGMYLVKVDKAVTKLIIE
jgi:hypothetical protein